MANSSMSESSTTSSASRLAEHTAYLESLISMVPPKFYFPADPDEMARKFQKYTGKQPQMPKHERKLQANERKRARLNPDQPTVPEQIAAQAEADGDSDSDGGDKGLEPERAVGGGNYAGISGGLVSTVSGLRDRLAEKLQQFRGSRGGVRKEGEVREKKPKESKQPKHQAPKRQRDDSVVEPNGTAAASTGGPAGKRSSSALEFNKLAAAAAAPKASKKRLSTAQLLATAEEKARLKRDRLAAADGGGEDAQIDEWQKALEKAGGIKQKDNPKLLRKTLKRQERQKKKSAREWKSRTKAVEKAKAEKQHKRTTNLAERKTKNKSRAANMKKRAGFEGKRSFLN